MSSELSVGGKLAKAATALLNEMDPDTFLHGIEPLKAALEGWAMAKTTPSDTALRRAGLYLDGLTHNGCNEVKTLRRLVVAAQQQGEPIAWMLEGMVGGNELAFQRSDLQDGQNRYGGELVPLCRQTVAVVPAGWKLVPIQPTREMLEAIGEGATDKNLARGRAIDAWSTMLDAAPFVPPVSEPVGMQSMETAPRDGTHILVKYIVTHYVREPRPSPFGGFGYGEYRPVGQAWAEYWFADGKFQVWSGTDKTRSINGGGEPIGWAPIPGDKAPEPHMVDLPAFDGYQAHIVRELQAAFVQACEKVNIKVKSPEVKS